MAGVDLTPIHRQIRTRCRRRVSAWLTAGVGVMAAVSLGCVGSLGLDTGGGEAIDHRLERANREIAQSERAVASARAKLARAEGKLRTLQRIGPQPDWSVLLAMLSQTAGEDVVLRRCALLPQGADDATGAEELLRLSREGYGLHLSGVGRSQSAIAQFVLRLEANPILDSVTLVKSHREHIGAGSAAGFEIACIIRPRGSQS